MERSDLVMESSNYCSGALLIRLRQTDEALPLALLLTGDPDHASVERYIDYCRWWLAEYENRTAGICGILQRSTEEWEIMNIAISPSYARQGIGSQLLTEVLDSLRAMNAGKVTAGFRGSRVDVLAFYQKHGFRIMAVEHDYFAKFDQQQVENGICSRDRLVMEHIWPDAVQRRRPVAMSQFHASVSIRIAQIRDAGPLLRMKKRLDEQTTYMLLEPGERMMNEAEQRDMIRYALRSANSNIFLAELDGQIIGYMEAMGGKVSRNRHSAYIVIGVLQDYANRGIGRRLFQTMLQWAKDRELHRIELTVQSANERGIHLYRSLGFRMEGIQKNALLVDNNYVDLIQMGLLL
ncbi:GNAT family N-acetyltransferase [Paenibacillus bovis]|nr:GNAT family N-acetyltransferase [Paenibacillus bovis]